MSQHANDIKNKTVPTRFANLTQKDDTYPEVSTSVVYFLDNEVQIEQNFNYHTELDLTPGSGNSIISISPKQALALAHFIIDKLENK